MGDITWDPDDVATPTGFLAERLAAAIWGTLQSPNVSDSNGEPANVVDALHSIAIAIHRLAEAIEAPRPEVREDGTGVGLWNAGR